MHLLFYADGSGYGGHEMTTLRAIRQLVLQPELRIGFMSHESNLRLNADLEEIRATGGVLERHAAPYVTRSAQGIRTQLARGAVQELARRFQTLRPDRIVLVQGSIEIASLGIPAAHRAGIKAVSYVPYAHTLQQTGAPLAHLRDLLNRRLYRLPSGFITCCRSGKQSLLANGVETPIEVVYHSVDAPPLPLPPREEARRELGLRPGACVAGMIGRIYLKQKGHDVLIEALSRFQDRAGNLELLIVGDGPDEAAVRTMASRTGLTERVHFAPWRKDLAAVYAAIDMLVIPSHYEGLPATMLEALHCGVPVIASDRDGMAEVLPLEWRFRTGDRQALMETILRVKCGDNSAHLKRLKARIASDFDAQTFGARFLAAITRLSQPGGA
jgi:glycosyltransferase involved in cell wall biosynthesis